MFFVMAKTQIAAAENHIHQVEATSKTKSGTIIINAHHIISINIAASVGHLTLPKGTTRHLAEKTGTGSAQVSGFRIQGSFECGEAHR